MIKIKLLLTVAIVAITFTSCSKNEESLNINNVYGEYSGEMKFDGTDFSGNIIDVPAQDIAKIIVNNNKIEIIDFPYKTIIVCMLGEEQADALVPQIGTINYAIDLNSAKSATVDQIVLPMTTEKLSITWPMMMIIHVGIAPEGDATYNSKGELTFKISTKTLRMQSGYDPETRDYTDPGTDLPFDANNFTFTLKKK